MAIALHSIRMQYLAALLVLALCAFNPGVAAAGWLSKLSRLADEASDSAKVAGSKTLKDGRSVSKAASHLATLPAAERGLALAVDATPSGHWRFQTPDGDTFTAATADEVARAIPTLLPQSSTVLGGNRKVKLFVSPDTVFKSGDQLSDLPPKTELRVVAGKKSYRLHQADYSAGANKASTWAAELGPNVRLEMRNADLFDEALFQLSRPLQKSSIRVLSLAPGGPRQLGSVPRIDPVTKATLIDEIDPSALHQALGRAKYQTILVTGRKKGDALSITSRSGKVAEVNVKSLADAAEANDVNLIIIDAATTRQPGGRNWLWQKVEVAGLSDALKRATFTDFLSALGGESGTLAVRPKSLSRGRISLETVTVGETVVEQIMPISSTLAEWIGGLTGQAVLKSVEIVTRDKKHQKELDLRIIPGIPSDWQIAYIVCLVIGLFFGLSTVRAWWQRVWPPELPEEYASTVGYRAAWIVRGLAFWLLFLPIVSMPAVTWSVLLQIWRVLTAPFRFYAWLTNR